MAAPRLCAAAFSLLVLLCGVAAAPFRHGWAAALSAALAPLQSAALAPLLAPAPAYYPRVAAFGNGSAFAAVERPVAGVRRIVLLARASLDGAWEDAGVIVEDATAGVDLGNPMLFASGALLLCAFRHHTGAAPHRVYRIAVTASRDGGRSWSVAPAVASAGPTGVWEPFLWAHSSDTAGTVRIVYAAEVVNGGEQDIVQRVSTDFGATWGGIVTRVHTPGSRNGMPGAAELCDSSVVLVFEAFLPGAWGAYVVNSARSFDGGATFPQRALVHAPLAAGRDAGSPQVGVCPASGAVVAVFMSNEAAGLVDSGAAADRSDSLAPPAAGGAASTTPLRWPDGAHIAVVAAHVNATDASAPLSWGPASATLPIVTASAFWPSLFVEPFLHVLRAAYQGDDSAAYLAEGALLCPAAPAPG